eukprot:TRINITY_DN12908_c0_g1_i1.p1 TRINITY_DN12908_c0_g1~~TRINITY_DN12908_c0_g1_i1.p1  ORF type:complete len:449 (-),score=187.05 TRINITY_DN12908_c0_g1_i1:25-1221(-)
MSASSSSGGQEKPARFAPNIQTSDIGAWGEDLRVELAGLEERSQKLSNQTEKKLFQKDGGPKVIYTKLTKNFLFRPELYRESMLLTGRHPDDSGLIGVVLVSMKHCLVNGEDRNIGFTYLGRIDPAQRSSGTGGFMFGKMLETLKERGLEHLTCYVLEENTHSIRIFLASGMLTEDSRVVFASTSAVATSPFKFSPRRLADDEAIPILRRLYANDGMLLVDLQGEIFRLPEHAGAYYASSPASEGEEASEAIALVWDLDYARIKYNSEMHTYKLIYSIQSSGPKGLALANEIVDFVSHDCASNNVPFVLFEASRSDPEMVQTLEKREGVLGSCVELVMSGRISQMLQRKPSVDPVISAGKRRFYDPRDFSTLMFFSPLRSLLQTTTGLPILSDNASRL